MIKRSLFTVGLVALFTVMAAFTAWAVPGLINYQGKLTDSGGNSMNGDFSMTFHLYDAETGGASVWNETQSVQVIDGIYSIELGSVSPFSADLFDSAALYLEVIISGEALTPRQRLTSTAFPMKAGDADTVAGLTPSEIAATDHSGSDITTGTVADARIAASIARDSEITWGKLANIPAGFADGVDDTGGITTETDPTVLASVKDGVSWGEIKSIPSGFADGVDNNSGGDITAVTAGSGLTGGGTSGTVTLNVATPFSLVDSVNAAAVIWGYNKHSTAGDGVKGTASGSSGRGVAGTASGSSGRGVYGIANNTGDVANYGGYFHASGAQGRGVSGIATGAAGLGVYGYASNTGDGTNYGGHFQARGSQGRGVFGVATNTGNVTNYGGYFYASGAQGRGVYGIATNKGDVANYGGYFYAWGAQGQGVYGENKATRNYGFLGGRYQGVYGESTSNHAGVYGKGSSSHGVAGRSSSAYGVYGLSDSSYGVYGASSSNYAGYFSGPVRVTGYLTKSGGGFQIDHPLDPENKYLNHSFVESPDMKNIYDGVVVLDANGERWVELPEWFEALSKDFRYQLTPIGAPGPNLFVAQKITDNRFKIAGGSAGMEVSWQVTGIRQDPWAEANLKPVEEDKAADELGFYLSPESYGQPEEKGIEWARNPEMMQRMQEEKEISVESDGPSAG